MGGTKRSRIGLEDGTDRTGHEEEECTHTEDLTHVQYNALVHQLPKVDIHLHLDGSLRLSTLIELAIAQNIDLPHYDEESLMANVFRSRYESLEEYLTCFSYTTSVLQTSDALERAAYELAHDCAEENICIMGCIRHW